MARVHPESLDRHIGHFVRIVYSANLTTQPTSVGPAVAEDDLTTPPVRLLDYDPKTKMVTYQRIGSSTPEKRIFKEVLLP